MSKQEWSPDDRNPGIIFHKKGFTVNALNYIKSTSTGGLNYNTTMVDISLKPFKRHLSYAEIDKIVISPNKGGISGLCPASPSHTEVTAYLNTGFGHGFTIAIKPEHLDNLIAAYMILAPKAELATR